MSIRELIKGNELIQVFFKTVNDLGQLIWPPCLKLIEPFPGFSLAGGIKNLFGCSSNTPPPAAGTLAQNISNFVDDTALERHPWQ